MVGRQMRERQLFPGLKALVLIVLNFKRTDIHMAVIKANVLAGKIGIVKSCYTIMVVQIVVIELRVGVMPKFVVTGNDGLVVMKYLERFRIEGFLHTVKRTTGPLFDRLANTVIQGYPDKPAVFHLTAKSAQAHILALETILITLGCPGDMRAVPFHVELPRVKHAGNVLGGSGR